MKIRLGNTFNRTWTFYNPLSADPRSPDNKKPNYASPINLSGVTIVFVIEQGKTASKTYPADGGTLQITPLAGKIEVEIPPSSLSGFKETTGPDTTGACYLQFTYSDGDVKTKAREDVLFITKSGK